MHTTTRGKRTDIISGQTACSGGRRSVNISVMDPEVSVLLHCTPWKGLREGQVRVELSTRRSQKVAEASGLLDIPGGHPEPKAVCMGVNEDSIRVEQLPQEAVVRELFSSVQAEIRDEVNIPLSCLSAPILMGIALNHTSAGRPSAEFYISCSLTAQEVKDFYLQGGPEASESTDIVFLSRQEVLQLNEGAPLWSDLCPSAKGAVVLYRLVLPDQD
ncbi:uridine diphosphate glucose pyrophosphatase NUDT22 isoform X4 [Paramormyrops kingsleyae]|uniref:uridine diphosphate glucose pyrophosphatase NUDT22 isoform X4 n=1 Tax=Paramormyrops kingsleyae TaxID=1676925 RepID=UPI003B97114E